MHPGLRTGSSSDLGRSWVAYIFKKKKEGRKEKNEKLEEKVTIFKCHLVRVAWWCHVAPPTPPHSYPTHLGWLEATAHIVFQL